MSQAAEPWTPPLIPLIYDDLGEKTRAVTQEDVQRWEVIEAQYRDIMKVVRRLHEVSPFFGDNIAKLHREIVVEGGKSSPFETGAVVGLKSGGPRLTVTGEKRSDGLVTCQWFVDGIQHSDAFDAAMLERAYP